MPQCVCCVDFLVSQSLRSTWSGSLSMKSLSARSLTVSFVLKRCCVLLCSIGSLIWEVDQNGTRVKKTVQPPSSWLHQEPPDFIQVAFAFHLKGTMVLVQVLDQESVIATSHQFQKLPEKVSQALGLTLSNHLHAKKFQMVWCDASDVSWKSVKPQISPVLHQQHQGTELSMLHSKVHDLFIHTRWICTRVVPGLGFYEVAISALVNHLAIKIELCCVAFTGSWQELISNTRPLLVIIHVIIWWLSSGDHIHSGKVPAGWLPHTELQGIGSLTSPLNTTAKVTFEGIQ